MRERSVGRGLRHVASCLLAAVCIAGCGGASAPQRTAPPDRVAEGVHFPPDASLLFLTPAQQRVAYRNIQNLAPTTRVAHGTAAPLPVRLVDLGGFRYEYNGASHTLDEFLERNQVAGLLALKDGVIAVEAYRHGNSATSAWTSFSMAKSILSLLYGAALRDGSIRSLDDSVVTYVKALRGSAYERVSLRQLLQMSSGVRWNEDETDRASDLARTSRLAQEQGITGVLAYMAKLPRAAEPGSVFNYNTGETLIAGAVLRAATGKPLGEYLAEKIWKPAGMEADAYWLLLRGGDVEHGGCCVSATLRDYARLGHVMLNAGVAANGEAVVSPDWIRLSTTPAPAATNYGLLWWLRPDGSFEASGIFGQTMNIDPGHRTVVVFQGLWSQPLPDELVAERRAFLSALTRYLR